MNMRDSIAAARISGPRLEADGTAVFEFRFGADDPVFAGHFPARPLLPGVFHLEMARVAAEAVLNCPLAVRAIAKAKFLRPIVPAENVCVEVKLSEKDGTIRARAGFSVYGQPAGETILQLRRSE
jgi:3-hydroxymyristoyl/3-hydroxydecanoyl-(acyl carrier protein) dehydratase